MMLPTVWQDGRLLPREDARVSAFDHTVLFGRGVFETLRLHAGVPFLLDRHIARLHAGLSTIDIEPPGRLRELDVGLRELAEANSAPDAVARITCTAGDGERPGTLLVHLRAVPFADFPVRVGLARFGNDPRSPVAGLKATNYLVHDVLRRRASDHDRIDDLLVDAGGHVTEGAASNVFFTHDGALVTPPRDGILAGITRELVLELAADSGLSVREETVAERDLGDIDEAFLTNAARGLVSIDILDGQRLADERPVTECLVHAYQDRVAGACGS